VEADVTARVDILSKHLFEGAKETHGKLAKVVGLQPRFKPGAPEYDIRV
jgi:hypothetical protein